MAISRCAALIAVVLSTAGCVDRPGDSAPPATIREGVTIPLNDIWALNMLGTRDVRELEPAGAGAGDPQDISFIASSSQEIATALKLVPGKEPDEGFAVAASGKSALQAAHDVLTGQMQRQSSFPAGSDVSIVFFSYPFGAYVRLESVKRIKNVIEIRYQFEPHTTRQMTQHFAIIPLGKLEPAGYGVDMIQMPMDAKFVAPNSNPLNRDAERKVICKSFSFSVYESK